MGKNTVLLLYPKTGVQNLKPQSPLSLLALAPALEEAGYRPVIVDTRVEPDYSKRIREHLDDTVFVGVTSMTGRQIAYGLELSREVRQLAPAVPVVWGGIHASMLPAETLGADCVDYVVVGEGEETVVELADALRDGGDVSGVPGVYYKDADGGHQFTGQRDLLPLESLRMPAWHLVDVSRYSEIGVQAGRGCPWRCTFCYNIQFNRASWRGKSTEQVVAELKLLKTRYLVDHVTFYDDNFFSSRKRAEEICRAILAEDLQIRWSTTCRADYLANYDAAFIEVIKAAGADILCGGSESGSEGILRSIQKKITTDDIRGMARAVQKHGLRVHTSFMVGFPGETEADRHATYALMDEIKAIAPKIVITSTCIYTPYPGNQLFDQAKERGFQPPASLEGWADFNYFHCNLPWIAPSDRVLLENLAFITRFVFWSREIKSRYLRWYHYPFYYPLRASALLRWKTRGFGHAWEWSLFRKVLKELE